MSERFILIQGTAAKPVAHVTFSGLAFRHGQWLTPVSERFMNGTLPLSAPNGILTP